MPELVKDFQGKLIPRNKARKIKNEMGKLEYFEEGASCVEMSDKIWYRTTTGKIIFDWSKKIWVFAKDFVGHKGLVEDGSFGHYSEISKEVIIWFKEDTFFKKSIYDPLSKSLSDTKFSEKKWNRATAINEKVAIDYGYQESIFDSCFYKITDCSTDDLIKMNLPNIPSTERTNVYSLDDDRDYRQTLEELYDNNKEKVPIKLMKFAPNIPFTFGLEFEVQEGHCPKRVREALGFRPCRDGSLGEGIEYVGIPMEGGKGLYFVKKMCEELSKRCRLSNRCSTHVHFGDVRRDKLYVISLWHILYNIQDSLRKCFPFSRTNSIQDNGKIYACLLPDLEIDVTTILSSKTDEEFKNKVIREFNKIYTWLNNGHPLGEKYEEAFVRETRTEIIQGKKQSQICYRVRNYNFTTKLPRHAVQGHKWNRSSRYMWTNILNLFFAHSRTIEFRISEATTNFNKVLMFMCLGSAILKYAENFDKSFHDEISLNGIIKASFRPKLATYLIDYFEFRKNLFCTSTGSFKSTHKSIETTWFDNDCKFKFQGKEVYEI